MELNERNIVRKNIPKVDNIVIFLLTFGVYALNRTSSVDNREYSWLAIIALTFMISLINILKNKKIYIGVYLSFQILFVVIAFASRYWAISPILAKSGFNSMLLTLFIVFSIINIIDQEEKIFLFIKALAWSGVFMIVYLGIKNGFNNIIDIRGATESLIITDINANDFGMKCVISALSAYTCGINNKKSKIIYNILTIFLISFSILTGSRKVIIMLVFCFGIFYIFSAKNKTLIRIIFAILVISIFSYLIMNIPFLYNIIGIRIEEVLNLITKSSVDPNSSTGLRLEMIERGVELFKNNPILGYGIANAAVFNNGVYLHNNYMELLVDIGIVGTSIYYFNLILSIIRNIKVLKIFSDKKALFFLLILICLLILDYTFVSYNARAFQIIIAISSHYYVIKKRKHTC